MMSQIDPKLQEIRSLEVIAFHSWPAREVVSLGDWLIRADTGVTRRANSVFPYGDPDRSTQDAINHVIRFYKSRGLIPRFQMTDASMPQGLDDALSKTGFLYEMKTYVQTCTISDVLKPSGGYNTELFREPTEEWFTAYARISRHPTEVLEVRKGIFNRMPAEKRFALVREKGAVLGISIGVLHRGWLGIFGVRTDQMYMRKGVAKSINRALLAWAQREGASKAYLQVEADNEPALCLYQDFGFTTKYTYWYRQFVE